MEGSIKKVGDAWQVRYDAGKDPVTGTRQQKKKKRILKQRRKLKSFLAKN